MRMSSDNFCIKMNEPELVRLYAKSLNNLNMEIIRPYLADDVVYESQHTIGNFKGIDKVYDNLVSKVEAINEDIENWKVFAELGYCGSQVGFSLQVASANEGRPCVVLAQGHPDNVLSLALLEIESGMIKRIDICTLVPHPSTAKRTGEYPK